MLIPSLLFYVQAAWIVDETDGEDSDGSEEEGNGMVLEEENGEIMQDGSDQSDIDEAPPSLEHFDEETEADTEMAVSYCNLNLFIIPVRFRCF